ncbi:MAG: nicotinate-nucleotide adenylyltransferase [Chitinophagaceae bacterium]|nr:nicotinate-nucleotide adenylyltransferase [Chitinophagaceae bacterium]
MKVGLYFGSFNPIHNGHLIVASHMVNYGGVERVWFVVSPQNPFKDSKSLLNEHHRKFLVDLAVEGDVRFKCSNVEFRLPRPSYTINTLVHLEEEYPGHEFSVIIGSDSFQNIKNWRNSGVLLKNYTFLIYKRPGFEIPESMLSERIYIIEAPLLQISGTYIRKLIKERKSIRYLVPDVVNEQIISQQFYF